MQQPSSPNPHHRMHLPLPKSSFWQDKRVIVTGGTGFLGSFVVEALQQRGAAEIIVPRRHEYDLRDAAAIRQLLCDTTKHIRTPRHGVQEMHERLGARPLVQVTARPVDMVIHLAANVGGIGINQARPAEFFYDNLMMGVQLLHECWQAGVSKFVAMGTICAYPKFAPIPFREETLWDGYPEETNAPYGLAKKMMLVQSQAYRQQYGYNSIFLLPVNLYGPRDNFDPTTSHVIPALIRKCLEAKASGADAIEVWGDGSPTREFLYVEDAAEGIVRAAEQYNSSEPVNLGSGEEITIRDLVQTIATLTDFTGTIRWNTNKPNGQPRRKLDIVRAQTRFNFTAQTPFHDGLQQTIAWYQAHQSNPVDRLSAVVA